MPADTLSREETQYGDSVDAITLRLQAARAEGVREGIEMAASKLLTIFERIDREITEAVGRKHYITASQCEAQAQAVAHALASVRALSPPPAEPTGMTADGDWVTKVFRPLPPEEAAILRELTDIGDEAALAEPSAPVAPEDDARCERAKALAEVYGVALQDVRSTVGDPEGANNWRRFLALVDDGWTPPTLRAKAALEAENAKLRERGDLVVAALDGPGANAKLLVTAIDGLRALLQGGPDAG